MQPDMKLKWNSTSFLFALALALASALVAAPASAHPHVLVTVRANFVLDTSGRITGIRHNWQFDEAYSAYASVGLKADKTGRISRDDLADLAKTNVESLQDFLFFTTLKQGRTTFEFAPPKEGYYLDHDGKALTLHFVLPLKTPVSPGKTTVLEVQDATFFVAFSYAPDSPVGIEGTAGGCRVEMKQPKKALSSGELTGMSENFFNNLKPNFVEDYTSNARLICP